MKKSFLRAIQTIATVVAAVFAIANSDELEQAVGDFWSSVFIGSAIWTAWCMLDWAMSLLSSKPPAPSRDMLAKPYLKIDKIEGALALSQRSVDFAMESIALDPQTGFYIITEDDREIDVICSGFTYSVSVLFPYEKHRMDAVRQTSRHAGGELDAGWPRLFKNPVPNEQFTAAECHDILIGVLGWSDKPSPHSWVKVNFPKWPKLERKPTDTPPAPALPATIR